MFVTGYAELLHSSKDMQNCYNLHRICRTDAIFTGYAELLRIYAYVPVMHSPQDLVQDTELQLSPPQRIGEGHLVNLTSQERVCIHVEGGYTALENILANCRFIR
jgi:hypothetical protein